MPATEDIPQEARKLLHIYEPAWIDKARQMVKNLDNDPDAYFKPAELVQYVLKRKPLFPAGQGFKYTDTGYILLGMIIDCMPAGSRDESHSSL
jgi:hypothetical protein